ncbi:MAG: hypothetical protein C0609_04445 [Deltaproteobacteria bacterium]|nr:MAG: hypothetical protein C0609_04445 [Deltaproteobacteria bacterium]
MSAPAEARPKIEQGEILSPQYTENVAAQGGAPQPEKVSPSFPPEHLAQAELAPADEANICVPAIGSTEAEALEAESDFWEIPENDSVASLLGEFTGPLSRSTAYALRRAGRYLPMIERVLEEEELPPELASLPMVESHYLPEARSSADAVGLWQFIESTAEASGLRVDWWVDQRLDPELATRAAARHLKALYERFGDWELSLAAYNAGPGGVSRALERSGTDNFWELADSGTLRRETKRYVPKFYAALAIQRDPESYGFAVAPEMPEEFDTVIVDSPVDLLTISRLSGISRSRLHRLNPSLRRECTPPGASSYPLRVPAGMGQLVEDELEKLSRAERLDFVKYTVKGGDSVHAIARRFGTSVDAISDLNALLNPKLIKPRQTLVIPVRKGTGAEIASLELKEGGRGTYVVRGGDNVWKIARAFKVHVTDIISWNGLGDEGIIRPGDKLYVSGGREADSIASRAGDVYVVAPGDSPWSIAERHGVDVKDLMRWNGLGKGFVIRPGDRLAVSAKGN